MNNLLVLKKHILRPIVKFLQKFLPDHIFNKFYDFTFPLYRKAICSIYWFITVAFYKWINKEKYIMRKKIYSVLPYTMVGFNGLAVTYQVCMEMNKKCIPGDFVELGVARGGCAALMGGTIFSENVSNERKLWLFDSFEGLPEPTKDDFKDNKTGNHVSPMPKGSCLGTLPEVKKLIFNIKNFPKEKVRLIKGWFDKTIPEERNKIQKIAVLRIDGDWYESVKTCLEGLYDKVELGGVIISDDYQSCYGAEKAVDEFIATNKLKAKIILDGRGGCYWYKTS
jgi:O-methyltransferase